MKKIILVEDDAAIRHVLELVFSSPDYHITCISNAGGLWSEMVVLPDLFILDKQIAGDNGLDICIRLKGARETSHIPVLMLSASRNIKAEAKAAGADAALSKPFRLADLRMIVLGLLQTGVCSAA